MSPFSYLSEKIILIMSVLKIYIFKVYNSEQFFTYQGVLSVKPRKAYLHIPTEVRQSIIDHYMGDSNRRCYAGMSKCFVQKVPGQKSIPVPKRLLLYDLKDQYHDWLI